MHATPPTWWVFVLIASASFAQRYELPLCNVSAPYASLPQVASFANVTTFTAAVFSTTTHFCLIQKFNYSDTALPQLSLWWRSNDIVGAASRARAFPAAASWTGLSTDLQPLATENITVTRSGEETNVTVASFPFSTAESLVWSPSGTQSRYSPIPLLAPVHPANLTGWVGGPAASPMMSLWAAVRGNRTGWPERPLYAGLDLSAGYALSTPWRPTWMRAGGRTVSARLHALCERAEGGAAMGSLVLGGFHDGYNMSTLLWSERVSPWRSESPPAPYTGWGALFPLARPQLCGLDLTDALQGTGHWLAEVDTGSACTVLPAPLFDAVARWAPLVNCPPPGRYSAGGGGEWLEGAEGGVWKECDARAASCGYSILDARVCDVHPDASSAVLTGTAGLPTLTAWLSTPQPAAAAQQQARMIQLPLADLMVRREAVRGPQGLADPVPGLPSSSPPPTHSLCLVRGSMSELPVEGPGVGAASQAQRALYAAGTQRIRIGTLALQSLYVAWELQAGGAGGGSGGNTSMPPMPWEEWLSTPMRPVRVGLANRGLGNGTAVKGYGPYAQCVQPVASTCTGGQAYSPVWNRCLDPSCSRYSLQTVDPSTGLCVMQPFTALLAILAITASGAITVYMYAARWTVAAAAVRHMSAAERGPGAETPPLPHATGSRRGAGTYEDLGGTGGSRSPARRAQVLHASQSSDARSGEAAFALLRHRQGEEQGSSVRQRRGAGGARRGSADDTMPPGLPRTWGSPFARQEEEETRAQASAPSFRAWVAAAYPTLAMVGRYASLYGRADAGEGEGNRGEDGEEEAEEEE